MFLVLCAYSQKIVATRIIMKCCSGRFSLWMDARAVRPYIVSMLVIHWVIILIEPVIHARVEKRLQFCNRGFDLLLLRLDSLDLGGKLVLQ